MRHKRMPPTTVNTTDIEHLARKAFRLAGEHTKDAALFWRMAALQHAGKISEYEFCDPFEAVSRCTVTNKPAFVRSCLKELLSKRGVDADALLRSVRVIPECPITAPLERSYARSI